MLTEQESDILEGPLRQRALPRGARNRALPRISMLFAVVLVVLATAGGVVAALVITAGTTEQASGGYEGSTSLTYWALDGTFADTMHAPLPGFVSGVARFPTVLHAAASYRINPATAGHLAVRWNFTEGTAAPVNTELEIIFTIAYGITGATNTVTVYVETQGTAPANPIVFQFFYDAGTGAPASVAVQAFTQVSQQCTAVGTCP